MTAAPVVFDLIWLAVLDFHQSTGDRLIGKRLRGEYPVVNMALTGGKRRRSRRE